MLAHSSLPSQERYTINAMLLASTRDCITAVPNQTTAIEGVFYSEAPASPSFLTVTAHRRTNELAVRPVMPDETLFQHLIYRWHAERGATSSIVEMAMCKAYLRIIGLGPVAIPLILRQMASEGDEPDMWFVALQILTDADPVTDEIRGDYRAMAERWLTWASYNGYAWQLAAARFPALLDFEWVRPPSPPTGQYNCIAWSVGRTDRKWWPDPWGVGQWFAGIARTNTMPAFIAGYQSIGYARCADGSLETGVEKIALYAKNGLLGELIPTHAAYQLANGNWTSKLGDFEDIEHLRVACLDGPQYGHVVLFMSRPRQPRPNPPTH